MKYYLDTAIWRDYYENRSDNLRPLGEWALELLRMIKENREIVLYSDLVVHELSKDFGQEKIKDILKIIADEGLLERVEPTDEHIKEAVKLSKILQIPSADCLHAILARDSSAVMITRDVHFEQLRFIADSKKPEELI
jgi:predicted nucleic acid-binding protein